MKSDQIEGTATDTRSMLCFVPSISSPIDPQEDEEEQVVMVANRPKALLPKVTWVTDLGPLPDVAPRSKDRRVLERYRINRIWHAALTANVSPEDVSSIRNAKGLNAILRATRIINKKYCLV